MSPTVSQRGAQLLHSRSQVGRVQLRPLGARHDASSGSGSGRSSCLAALVVAGGKPDSGGAATCLAQAASQAPNRQGGRPGGGTGVGGLKFVARV
jgi:hypothetical protein